MRRPNHGGSSHLNWRGACSWNAIFAVLFLLFIVTSVPYLLAYTYYRSIIYETIPQSPLQNDTYLEKYTIVVLSQPKRLGTLKTVIGHYSRCPSVDSIVIVWGDTTHPLRTEDLPTVDVPIRIRKENVDSLNNRFKIDPLITTEAVFSLDDDTLMWCQDVENGFEEWKLNRNRLVGFFPRLAVKKVKNESFLKLRRKGQTPPNKNIFFRYLGESETYKKGEYNLILTVGMFYNVALMEEYWKPVGFPAVGREIVNKVHNCEDILMNYIAAGRLKSLESQGNNSIRSTDVDFSPVVKFVRPRRRLDISKLSSVGISHHTAAHLATRERCLFEFSNYIRSFDLVEKYPELPIVEKFNWDEDEEAAGMPICWLPLLGCIYL